jgi:outer membrane protein OmpA-like peptidoglycan-associated protein
MKRAGFLVSSLVFLVPLTAAAQGGTVTFGGGASASTSEGVGASGGASASGEGAAKPDSDKEWEERDRKLNEAATLTGGVGLLHTQHAQGGAAGQFRLGFTTEYMSASFLCTSEFPCRDPKNPANTLKSDSGTDHIGGSLTLSMQVTKWLEPYLATSAFANSNASNRPTLLQVLGDSTLGAKAHGALGKVFHAGGAFELWLVNGTGSVGLDGAGTSAKFRGLLTADLRGATKPIPLRFSFNATYVLDNTGEVVVDTEKARGTSITRIERYGLNINRVDHFDMHLGGEVFAAQEKVRPFVEYQIAIPVNRQDYRCRPNNPSFDKCLANEAVAPSSLTLGGRFFPWKRGFNLVAAVDVGITGVGTFIEEVRPTPPWMLYLGAGWAFDTWDRPPVVQEKIVEKPVAAKTGRKIRGFIHEEGKQEGIPGAIVSWENHPELTSLAAGPDGRFVTQELDEGPYVFGIKAEGYKPGQCTTTIVRPSQPPPAPPSKQGPPAQPPPPAYSGDLQLDCTLQALPRIGNIVGRVRDAEGGGPVGNVAVKVLDVKGRDWTGTTDAQGNFRFEGLTPGEGSVSLDHADYLATTEKVDIKPRQDNVVEIKLQKRPKTANVTVGKTEIFIKQQIQFALDSAVILPESNGLLTEIADVMIKNPRIRKVEVQGHTDNSGTVEHNQKLSEDRAASVVAWLTSHGVSGDRLVPKGYGQGKPLVPNVTAANRAKNRRVQFIILDQDTPPAAQGAGGAKK